LSFSSLLTAFRLSPLVRRSPFSAFAPTYGISVKNATRVAFLSFCPRPRRATYRLCLQLQTNFIHPKCTWVHLKTLTRVKVLTHSPQMHMGAPLSRKPGVMVAMH
jgi:hypothetical protein